MVETDWIEEKRHLLPALEWLFQSEVIGPVVLGMVIRHFSTKIALWMEKAASILGTLFLLAALVTGVVSNSHLFTDHWKLWIASALLMPLGSTLGYVNARLARLPSKACRTICLETGLQNSTLALTILAFSFGDTEKFRAASVFPLLYSLFLLVDGVLITLLFRFLSRNDPQSSSEKEPKEPEANKYAEKGISEGKGIASEKQEVQAEDEEDTPKRLASVV